MINIEGSYQNRGVIEGKRDTDYVAGVLPYKVRNPSGDWTPFLPAPENQFSNHADSQACVTFSALNSIECQTKFLTGQEVNYSDRFIAKMSGTTPQGNTLYTVADTIRKLGLVWETDYPTPPDFDWNTYYASVPPELITKALLWLNDWSLAYEWIEPVTADNLIYHLKHAPLQIVIPGHAVVDIYETKDVLKYFDSYPPYTKSRIELPLWALKLVLTKKNMTITKEQLDKLYQLGFKRPVDGGGIAAWSGKELDVVLDGLLQSKENQEYTPISQAVKKLENDIRSGIF